MRVIGHVLRKIDNDTQLKHLIAKSPAVAELVTSYNTLVAEAAAAEDKHLVIVNGETYGQEFKHYLSYLPSLDLHGMLDRYLSHFAQSDKGNATHERDMDPGDEGDGTDVTAPSDDKSDKHFKRWLIKFGLITATAVFFIVVGAVVAIVTHNHTADNAVFKAIMGTATEVIKILFSTK